MCNNTKYFFYFSWKRKVFFLTSNFHLALGWLMLLLTHECLFWEICYSFDSDDIPLISLQFGVELIHSSYLHFYIQFCVPWKTIFSWLYSIIIIFFRSKLHIYIITLAQLLSYKTLLIILFSSSFSDFWQFCRICSWNAAF